MGLGMGQADNLIRLLQLHCDASDVCVHLSVVARRSRTDVAARRRN